MNSSNRISDLRKQIEAEESKIKSCVHVFKDPVFDPETIKVQDDRAGYETHGVDRWPVPSYHDETKNRWSRECNKCGLKQYTYTQEPVVSAYKPKF